ncbi:MAG: hypothetical protein AAF960_04720 [Bacteroidota bacterium]
MNKPLKYSLMAIATLVVIGGIATTFIFNAPKMTVENKSVDFQLSATELYQEYNENESVADQKYIDQVIEVSGTIFELSTDQQGATVVLLATGDSGAGVLCTLVADAAFDKKVGDSVTLKGVCTGKLMEVVLNRCVTVEG